MEEVVHKFEKLQKYIPFLENFAKRVRSQVSANNDAAYKKYEKVKSLVDFLKGGFKSKYTITTLNSIETSVTALMKNVNDRIATSAHIKTEKINPESIKMENDFQSPESPPMYQDIKCEREPITIPTERLNFFYDVNPSTSNDNRRQTDRYDDRRSDRRVRSRDKSRDRSLNLSRSRSPSRERRYRDDRKRYRYSRSRSRSRSRERSKRRSRSRDRSRNYSPSHRRSPSYRRSPSHRRSPSYQRRSISPHNRHRRDQKYERKNERNRDYTPDYDRYESKRNVKPEIAYNMKQELISRRENRDEPSTSSANRQQPTVNRFSAAAAAASRQNHKNDHFKFETNRNVSRPNPTKSRFSVIPDVADDWDAVGFNDSKCENTIDAIDELERKNQNLFGVSESVSELKKEYDELAVLEKLREDTNKMQNEALQQQILSDLGIKVNCDSSAGPARIECATIDEQKHSQQNVQNNIRSDVQKDIRSDLQKDIRSDVQKEIRSDLQKDIRSDVRIEVRKDLQNNAHTAVQRDVPINARRMSVAERRPENPFSKPPENSIENRTAQPVPTAPTNVVPRAEERIAYSNKYQRRPRNRVQSNDNTAEINDPHSNSSNSPQQDPRLRNRPNEMQIAGPSLTEQFMSFGNNQPSQPSLIQNAFGPNLNRNHPQNMDLYQSQVQRPFYDRFNNQQQYPNRSGPPNNYSPNASFGMQSPHNNVRFGQNPGSNQAHETYADHKRRMREIERREQEMTKKAASAVTSTTIVQGPINEPSNESPSQSEPVQNKDVAKDTAKEVAAQAPNKTTTAPPSLIDKAFRSKDWEAIPQTKSSSFRIPKLNKQNSNSATNATPKESDARRDSSENNVSTTSKVKAKSNETSKDPRLNQKKAEPPKRRKSIVDTKRSSKTKANDDQILADTTIITEPEPTEQTTDKSAQPNPANDVPVPDVLKLLEKQLPATQFEQIKNIIQTNTQPNDNSVTSSTQLTQSTQDNATNKTENQTKAEWKTPRKTPKKHSNELERLTADIRENIPDVLNATGRRACTLNTTRSTDSSPTKTPKSAQKSNAESLSNIDKPCARINRRRDTSLGIRPIIIDDDDDDDTPSENTDTAPLTKRITKRRGTICESNMRNGVVDFDSEAVFIPPMKKPGPKSATMDSKIMDVENLANKLPQCSVVLEPLSKEMQRITRSSKRKADQLNTSDGSEKTDMDSESVDDITTAESKRQKIGKNIDKTNTSKSKKCHICVKNYPYLSSHYTNTHEGVEVFCARMSEANSNKVRRNAPKNATYSNGKLTSFCFYCEKNVSGERSKWITHLNRHTGEYTRLCKQCGITVKPSTGKSSCSHENPKILSIVEFDDTLFVYMCNYCNFTQSSEDNMKKHVRVMHEVKENVDSRYKKIDLIPNFHDRRKPTTHHHLPTSDSEATNNDEELQNQNVFKTSNQEEDDVLSDSFKVMKENTFNNFATVKVTNKTIVDRLSERFAKQKEDTPSIKQEMDAHEVRFCGADDMARSTDEKSEKGAGSLGEGGAIEKECKIEVNKTEANVSGIQAIDVDDGDDQNWESCSDESDDDDTSSTKPASTSVNFTKFLRKEKQKQNKRVRGKKRVDKPIVKKEKVDIIIDLDDVKTEVTSPIKVVPDDRMRVENISCSELLGSKKYYCIIGNCDFLSLNNPKAFATHLRNKHATERWSGVCYTCDQQIVNGVSSLMKEYDHMIAVHMPHNQPKLTPKVPELPKAQIEPPKPVEPVRPMIRLRRLSGDKLSGANEVPQQLQPPPTPVQQPPFPIQNGCAGATMQVDNSAKDEENFVPDSRLKPWTKCANTKSSSAEEKLKRDFTLMALFKCMAIDCIFSTSDKDKMLEHLTNHEEFFMNQASYSRNHSNQDDGSWLECCYCEEIPGTCTTLVDHIVQEHGSSIFQCPYCFYRSVDKHNVSSHLKQHHANEDEIYMFVCGTELKSLSDEILTILANRSEKVKVSLMCSVSGCNATFVHLFELNQHCRTFHSDQTQYKCPICPKMLQKFASGDVDTKHLQVHGFSLCHCAYCDFGATQIEPMQAHLRDEHPTRLPYSYIRISSDSSVSNVQPSIAYFGVENNECGVVHSLMTEAQLNFMNPSLSEYAANAGEPPEDGQSSPLRPIVQKKDFINAETLEKCESNKIKMDYNIKTVADLLAQSVKKAANDDTPTDTCSSNDFAIQKEIDTVANDILSETGVTADQLYRCGAANCTWVRSDEREFLAHLSQHKNNDVLNCYHCHKSFTTPVDLKNHIGSTHLIHRFFCWYCDATAPTEHGMDDHFVTSHNKDEISYVPLNPNKFDMTIDIFIGCPKLQPINEFINRLFQRTSSLKGSLKKTFMPEEEHLLPKKQIFDEEMQCGRCFFSNKVRVNLVRHFRNGCTEQQAPVNPVPCLSTNVRHFDKMKNLAASSNLLSLAQGLPKFIAEEKRYVCGATSCKYQTQTADMLGQHITALHGADNSFTCPHCNEAYNSSSAAQDMLNHLRLHDAKIHKCQLCTFVHYDKSMVEKHINETHSGSKERTITLDRSMKKPEAPKSASKPITYTWKCNICETKTFSTRALVRLHLNQTHRLEFQYKCAICSFSHDTKNTVKEHLSTKHNENDATKIKSNYERKDSEADNSPIWRRNDPTRVKHIRGILFDDAEKTVGKQTGNQSNSKIPLVLKSIKFLKPTTTNVTVKKVKVTQDDSALNYGASSANNRMAQQSLDTNENGRFIILPPKENVEEEVRPRPASLRQQPKRRFSTYIPSAPEIQPSTSTSQPPISLRLKRISDPVPDVQKMPPPKLVKIVPAKKVDKIEPADLSTLNLIYVCNYCKTEVDTFDQIHAHWLSVHKKGNNSDPVSKRFGYRITQRVKCVFCPSKVTFQTIKSHMQEKHPLAVFAFSKCSLNVSGTLCGICGINVGADAIRALQNHFRTDHPQSQRTEMKIEPMSILNDSIVEALLQQGDRGTFKCFYCGQYFPCRYDFEQHHLQNHGSNPLKFGINGKDVIKYGCTLCRNMYTDENLAIDHLRSHVQQYYQCLYCPKQVSSITLIQTHHQLIHESSEIGFRVVNARDNLNTFYQMTLTFSNGLTLIWGDVLNTKYGGIDRLVKYINELNEVQRQQQLKTLKSTSSTFIAMKSTPAAGKLNKRRQTLL